MVYGAEARLSQPDHLGLVEICDMMGLGSNAMAKQHRSHGARPFPPHCCDQIPDKTQLRKRRIYFGCWFKEFFRSLYWGRVWQERSFAPILTDQETETGQEVELVCKIPGPTQSDSLPSERLHLQKVPQPPPNRTTSWGPHV